MMLVVNSPHRNAAAIFPLALPSTDGRAMLWTYSYNPSEMVKAIESGFRKSRFTPSHLSLLKKKATTRSDRVER